MSRKIGFLQRWMFIIDKINAHPYITKEELEEAISNELSIYDGVNDIGTKSRTIERDLHEIRNSPQMDISIEYCRQRKGYYIPQDEKSISRLDRMFELSSLLSFSSLKDIVFVENRKSHGLQHRFGLIHAIRKSVEVDIEYRKFDHTPSAPGTRRLQPYALREFRNRWYLLAHDTGNGTSDSDDLRTYGLDRIEKLTITARTFRKNRAIDLNEKFEHCFGIYANRELKPEKVVLSFLPLNGKYIDSCPLHESQQTLVHNEHEFRIELIVKITPDFINELLLQSRGMRVIEPLHLRDTLIGIHREAIRRLEQEG